MIALGYVRRSKKSGAGTVSLQAQEDAIRAYCQSRHWQLDAVVSHDGISGTKRERLTVIEQERLSISAGAVVIYNLDRLARDSAGLLDYLRSCTKHGIEVHETTSGKIDFKKSLGRLVVTMRGAMDEFYASVIGEKTRDALLFKKEAGQRYTNIPPFGFRYDGARRVEDDSEQQALKLIYYAASRGMGRHRILKMLREKGYCGRGSLSTIQRLILEQKEQPLVVESEVK